MASSPNTDDCPAGRESIPHHRFERRFDTAERPADCLASHRRYRFDKATDKWGSPLHRRQIVLTATVLGTYARAGIRPRLGTFGDGTVHCTTIDNDRTTRVSISAVEGSSAGGRFLEAKRLRVRSRLVRRAVLMFAFVPLLIALCCIDADDNPMTSNGPSVVLTSEVRSSVSDEVLREDAHLASVKTRTRAWTFVRRLSAWARMLFSSGHHRLSLIRGP